MSPAAIIVSAVTVLILCVLAATKLPPDAVLMGGLTILMVIPFPGPEGWHLGVVNVDQAFAGFSNTGLLTVGVLFIVVRGLRETGAIDWVAQNVLGRPNGLSGALTRLVFPTLGLSAFMNNTPLVAMMIPAVGDWARRLRIPPSKLMLPLSYAAVLGGMCTLVGTSTNLVVGGLASAQGGPEIRMFDITWVGLPCAVAGALYILIVMPRLLPSRGSAASTIEEVREYIAEMIVPDGSPLIGRSIEEAGLRHLPGGYLAAIERDGESLLAVGPHQILRAEDRLVFAGVVESIKELQNLRGLIPATNQVLKLESPRYRRQLFEAAVSNTSPMLGKTIREGRFRNRYSAVVLAVSRSGERIQGKIGDIVLRAGDTLLIEAAVSFASQNKDSREFFLVSPIEDSTPRRYERSVVAVAILAGMVVLAGTGVMGMLQAAVVAAAAMIASRCCSMDEARSSIDWSVLIVIGAALGIGQALNSTGAASALVDSTMGMVGGHPWAALAGVYLVTVLLTEVLTNNAAVALAFPLANATAVTLGVNVFPFLMAIMIAGSAGFSTPIGYQTNLMVLGPGGYRFSDYVKAGIPLNIIVGTVAILLIPFIWPF